MTSMSSIAQQVADAFAHDGMIFDDEDANHVSRQFDGQPGLQPETVAAIGRSP